MKINNKYNYSIRFGKSFNNLVEYLPKKSEDMLSSEADKLVSNNGIFTLKQSFTDKYNLIWGHLSYKSLGNKNSVKKSEHFLLGSIDKKGIVKLSKDVVPVVSCRMSELIQPPNISSQIVAFIFGK